ncbi:Crp/Fnr family transcriptional regulator [Budviciaceae bacterium BWR-B9]|uniref:Crp/Fnr family transcriptional regulator n=1 Tax=Limnobaculum allomyrinae TaxID=2791986 RepID=A0ABS1IL27_9GAMM|nr:MULTISPECIES: Crp/Fnr family transcriptional regulator [Limnobaculum]MBK5142443.1 Crp/Fnr family transcriptional regulator [Limnobaculum allomyrinae]MBV7690672.1 Crp/Fnr family transcriptional regulator [Limnobaculum sp. M2-1]
MNLYDEIPDKFRQKIKRKRYSKGEAILFSERENDSVYFMIEGKAEAYIPTLKGTFSNIYLYAEGSFFGEIEQFYKGRKPVSITASTECVVDTLHKDHFLEWLSKDFESTKFLIQEIAHKLIINSDIIEELSSLTIKERVLRRVFIHHKNNTLCNLTKIQLSKEVNAPIRSVNRIIEECMKQGAILYEKKKFVVTDEDFLSRYSM